MNTAFVLVGSNLGDKEENFKSAKAFIEEKIGRIIRSSSLYETAAWGKTDQPAFLNQALQIQTNLTARELMREILKIEKDMGRERREKYGPRIIDIDILLFNEEQRDDPDLRIPHPELQNRLFALIPLAEIAPNLHHPVFKKSILHLLKECPDQLAVKKIPA